jgi:hypothetical protein
LFGGPLESYDRVRLQVVVDIKIPKIKTFDETTVHDPLQFVWRDGMASTPLKYYRALHSISAAGKLLGNTTPVKRTRSEVEELDEFARLIWAQRCRSWADSFDLPTKIHENLIKKRRVTCDS